MEIRVLNYFLAVAREQNFSKAAEILHLTQPTLSRQLADLEEEIGKPLFNRGRKVTLTEYGVLFRKRAEEIIDLVNKTKNEMSSSYNSISGDIYIGTGKSDSISIIANVCKQLQKDYPGIHYNFISDDATDVIEKLDNGLIDFGILFGNIDKSKYHYITLPLKDIWGVLMRKDSELAKLKHITFNDLKNKPLIISRQSTYENKDKKLFGIDYNDFNIIGSYNLIYNASILVKSGMGYALTIDKLVNVSGDSELTFIPLYPEHYLPISIVWKKYQIFSKPAEKFLEYAKSSII